MSKRIGIFGVSEEVLRLVQLLGANPEIEVVRYWAKDRKAASVTAYALGPEVAAEMLPLLTEDIKPVPGGDSRLDPVTVL